MMYSLHIVFAITALASSGINAFVPKSRVSNVLQFNNIRSISSTSWISRYATLPKENEELIDDKEIIKVGTTSSTSSTSTFDSSLIFNIEQQQNVLLGKPIPYNKLTIGVLKETYPGENRVAQTPDSVKNLIKAGLSVAVQAGGKLQKNKKVNL